MGGECSRQLTPGVAFLSGAQRTVLRFRSREIKTLSRCSRAVECAAPSFLPPVSSSGICSRAVFAPVP